MADQTTAWIVIHSRRKQDATLARGTAKELARQYRHAAAHPVADSPALDTMTPAELIALADASR